MMEIDVIKVPGIVDGLDRHGGPHPWTSSEVTRGDQVFVTGWILLEQSNVVVWLVVDGLRVSVADMGVDRPDVEGHLGVSSARRSGFLARLDTGGMSLGAHSLGVEAVDADGNVYVGDGTPCQIFVVDEEPHVASEALEHGALIARARESALSPTDWALQVLYPDALSVDRSVRVHGAIDELNGSVELLDGHEIGSSRVVPRGRALRIGGWYYTGDKRFENCLIVVAIDGVIAGQATRSELSDMPIQFGKPIPEYRFAVTLPSHLLLPGPHELALILISRDVVMSAPGPLIRFRIVESALAFSIVSPNSASVSVTVDEVDGKPYEYGEMLALPFGSLARIHGWAKDLNELQPCAAVHGFVDGLHLLPTAPLERQDVASALGSAFLFSGFTLHFDTEAFGIGIHRLSFLALDAQGRNYGEGAVIIVNITH